MTKKKIIFLLIIVIILSVFFIPRIVNPLRRSEFEIERYLLKKIPLGTSYHETKKVMKEDEYRFIQKYETSLYNGKALFKDVENVFEANIGDYPVFLSGGNSEIRIYANFEFDENNKLIDIQVEKTMTGL